MPFFRVDLESGSCLRDRILIYPDFDVNSSSTPEVESRCGFDEENVSVDAARNFVVVFQSDGVVSGRGFKANVKVVSVN